MFQDSPVTSSPASERRPRRKRPLLQFPVAPSNKPPVTSQESNSVTSFASSAPPSTTHRVAKLWVEVTSNQNKINIKTLKQDFKLTGAGCDNVLAIHRCHITNALWKRPFLRVKSWRTTEWRTSIKVSVTYVCTLPQWLITDLEKDAKNSEILRKYFTRSVTALC